MGDIQRRVLTLFDVRGSDRVRAALGQMEGGFANYRRQLDFTEKAGGAVNAQLRALGTTLRYSLAGAGIYGTMQLVRNLGEFQAKLGEIQSIATGPNGLPLVDAQIDKLGQRLIDVSNQTTQPISDLQDGVLNLYSTIGNVPDNKAASMMEEISKVAITSQSNIQDTTQALLGMLNAFGRGTGDLGKFGDEFYKVIQLSAGMTGATYAQKLGVLSASASLARFTPEQMGALAIGATRFGGSANTNMTYLAQLLTYLVNPTTSKEKAAFASIGLNGQALRTLPGQTILDTVLKAINDRGGVGISKNLATANEDTLSLLDQMNGGAGATNAQAGISGGGAQLLQALFGRIQSRRMAAILSRLYSQQQVQGTENKTLDQYLNDVKNSAGGVDQAMGRAMDYRRIQQASNAMHNLGIEIGTALSPLLQYPSRGFTAAISDFNNQNWRAPIPTPWGTGHIPGQTLELAGGGLGIAFLLRALRNGGRGAGALRGLPIAAAGLDALSGDTQRGHSPLNPLYVAVVYSLANGWSGRGAMGIPNRDLRTAEGELGAGSGVIIGRGAEKSAARASRLSRIARTGGGFAASLGISYEIDQAIQSWFQTRGVVPLPSDMQNTARAAGHPLLNYLGIGHRNVFGQPVYQNHPSKAEQKIIDAFGDKKLTAAQAEARLRRLASPDQLRAAGITLKGKADVTVTLQDTQGKKKGSAHVTTDLFPDFTTPAPQTKGKPVTRRGNK